MVARFRALAVCAALAGGLAAPALAASPACALLSGSEAEAAVGGFAAMKDGGAAKDGYSDCAWNGPDGAVLSVLFWSAERFADGHASAAEKYDLLAADLKRRGAARAALDGLAERAIVVDESSPGFQAAGVVLLKGGQVAQISARGVSVSAALSAAEAVAGRLAATPVVPPDEQIVPQPKPPEIAALPPEPSPEPPAAEPVPEPAPEPPVAEPVPEPQPPVAEPVPEPAPPEPEPVPEPVPEPMPEPVPEPAPQPPVAEPVPEPQPPEPQPPVAEPVPEPEPTPPVPEPVPQPQPEPQPPVVEPVPEPETAPPIRPTEEPAAQTGSPACLILPLAALEKLLPGGAFLMEDRGPAVGGESNCRWSRPRNAIGIALTLLDAEAIAAAAPDANAFFDELEGPGPDNGIETLAGVGERALLQTLGEGKFASYAVSILHKGRIVFLNLNGIDREAALKLALAVAGKM